MTHRTTRLATLAASIALVALFCFPASLGAPPSDSPSNSPSPDGDPSPSASASPTAGSSPSSTPSRDDDPSRSRHAEIHYHTRYLLVPTHVRIAYTIETDTNVLRIVDAPVTMTVSLLHPEDEFVHETSHTHCHDGHRESDQNP